MPTFTSIFTAVSAVLITASAALPQGIITTIAGADPIFTGEGKPAAEATLGTIRGVAIDRNQTVFFTDADFGLLLKLGPNNTLEVIAGTGVRGFSGDNGPARAAQLGRVAGVAVDAGGNLYVADNEELRLSGPNGSFRSLVSRVRKVASDGTISTIAGGGANARDEDIPATEASLSDVSGVAVDPGGNLYVTELGRARVRRISPEGRIRTFAGTVPPMSGPPSSNIGDGGPATAAVLQRPVDVIVDREGGVFIVDQSAGRVRRVAADGAISTVVGGGNPGPPQPAQAATSLSLTNPSGIAIAPDGSTYVLGLSELLRIGPDNRVLSRSNTGGPPNNGGPVNRAGFKSGIGLGAMASDADGNIYVADSRNYQLRRIGADGIVHAFAGTGVFRQEGENWSAADSFFNAPTRLATGAQGQIYVLDRENCKVREIQSNGLLRTVAGNGLCSTTGGPNYTLEGLPATSIGFGALSAMAADLNGNLYVFDGIRVVRVEQDGRIFAVVNKRSFRLPPFADGDVAIDVSLDGYGGGIALDRAGNIYIADVNTHRIRKVSPDGIITTVAGGGPAQGPGQFGGDGGPALEARLNRPIDVAVDRFDNMYILDSGNRRIRKVTPAGIITTFAGPGAFGDFWSQLAVDSTGNLYASETLNHRVWRISVDGGLTAVAGSGEAGFSGDGGRPDAARLTEPTGVAVDALNNLYIGDTGNHRVRRVSVP
ncbi:MAG TPA: hypothetical protein VM120_17655 [Bryobacteraceae bacterium]|nr:hypothetical protein [Bryobacteraceae bacterium]